MTSRLTILKSILWIIVGIWAMVTVARFTHGLGATTNLSDVTPWGLWIGFDVMAGVALAAGGFVLAATVYIFGLERYRPFVRPAILTAFLGYIAVAVGLLYDLGLPWNIWHPMINWQHHSVLFEVAMCVMLYLSVLALEFAPTILENSLFDRPLFRRILAVLKKVTLPLVVAGIILSTLHQSSLGSLFLIAPHRLHPLWYSPIIYLLFFVSAVGLGLMMVTLESLLSGYFFKHKVNTKLLSGLGLAASVVLGIYVAIRVGDMAIRGVLGGAFEASWMSTLFWFELCVCAVIPAILLAIPRIRRSIAGLGLCSGMTVFGMVMYRIDVCIVAFARPEGFSYFPHWTEFAVSLGIVAAAVLVFIFFVERLKVYEHPMDQAEIPTIGPSFDPVTVRSLVPAAVTAPRRYSLLFIVGASLAIAFLPQQAVLGTKPHYTPVAATRTIDGFVIENEKVGEPNTIGFIEDVGAIPAGAMVTPLIIIDGNRDGRLTLFNHQGHEDRLGGEESCASCHHLNMPMDRASSCHECHRDMYEPTLIFNHESHVRGTDGNQGCVKCHDPSSAVKSYETATACRECHAESIMSGPVIADPEDRWNSAVGYMAAMHGLCRQCHINKAEMTPGEFPVSLQDCRACHNANHTVIFSEMIPRVKNSESQ